jgi:endonuclease VIII
MPEGPSIVILREEVQQFRGKKILLVSGNTKTDIAVLQNKTVRDFKSWGKHFLICFDTFFVKIHLLMFGSYRVNESKPSPARLSLKFKNGVLNFYNCSVKIIAEDVNEVYDWETDPMSESWNEKKVRKAVALAKERMICDVLMDQEIFTGVGNIIKNEVLYRVRVQPESITGAIPAAKQKEIVREAALYCHQFYEWKKQFVLKKNWLIMRKRICPRCDLPAVKKITGKGARISFFCRNCQVLYRGRRLKKVGGRR